MPGATPDALRAEVRRLRDESAEHRVKGKWADTLARALVASYAEQTGRLADPTDLAFDPALLDDDGMPTREAVAAAVEALLVTKPHLASRQPRGDVEQGARATEDSISLAGMLRANA